MTALARSRHRDDALKEARLGKARAPWLRRVGVRAVAEALAADGARPRFVGGCVRNALLGAAVNDLDIAIDIAPKATIELLKRAGLRAIPTGLDHGTVTTVTPKARRGRALEEPIEITSLRRDVATDGRRAVVAFTTDWAEDAARRDFTMNALYADVDGQVFDPLGDGVADLRARRVRFIGRAEERIQEDYLRILRYFRFIAWYGDGPLDRDDMTAVERLGDGLDRLPAERIGGEVRKLLAAPSPAASIILMVETDVFGHVFGPALDDGAGGRAAAAALEALERVEHALDLAPDWKRRLTAMRLADAAPDRRASALTKRLRLSNAEAAAMKARLSAIGAPAGEAAYRFGAEAALDAAAIAAAQAGAPPASAAWETLRRTVAVGAGATPPVRAADFIAAGVAKGPALGALMKAAEENWIRHNFALDRDALVALALQENV